MASCGEIVVLFHRKGPNVKFGPQWILGVWLTKTDGDDLHVVATPNGILRGKAIRRLSDFGAPTTPRPVVEKRSAVPDDALECGCGCP